MHRNIMLTKSQKRNLRRTRLKKEGKFSTYPFHPYIDGRNDHPFLSSTCKFAKEWCSPKCVECGYQSECWYCSRDRDMRLGKFDGNKPLFPPEETDVERQIRLNTYAKWLIDHPINVRTTYNVELKKIIRTQIPQNGCDASIRQAKDYDRSFPLVKEGYVIYFGYGSCYDMNVYSISGKLMFDWPIYLTNKEDDTAGMICDMCCNQYIKNGQFKLIIQG